MGESVQLSMKILGWQEENNVIFHHTGSLKGDVGIPLMVC